MCFFWQNWCLGCSRSMVYFVMRAFLSNPTCEFRLLLFRRLNKDICQWIIKPYQKRTLRNLSSSFAHFAELENKQPPHPSLTSLGLDLIAPTGLFPSVRPGLDLARHFHKTHPLPSLYKRMCLYKETVVPFFFSFSLLKVIT